MFSLLRDTATGCTSGETDPKGARAHRSQPNLPSHSLTSARILAAIGFEALATTSAGFAFSTGYRDAAAAVSRKALLQNARQIAEATELPVSADLKDGFGRAPWFARQGVWRLVYSKVCGGNSGAPPMPCVSYFPWTSAPRMARMVHWSKTIQAVKIWNSYVD